MANRTQESDFLVVGGGLTGSVVASRLATAFPSAHITVLEAGGDAAGNPLTSAPMACLAAHFSPIDWAYETAPQKHLNGRRVYAAAGKALGGGTNINYGVWSRGAREDYDAWADLIGDARWGYDGLLKYFRRTERHLGGVRSEGQDQGMEKDETQDLVEEHGYEGPITTAGIYSVSPLRKYGLREPLREAWEASGVPVNPHTNGGKTLGLHSIVENWRDGKRQVASDAYGLKNHANVTIVTGQIVTRILVADDGNGGNKAVGAETADGTVYRASKEVIVACGAYRTPQLLLLSGIGPAAELSRHGIPQLVDLPVGRGFHDHFSLYQFWRVSQPELGMALGTPLWSDPAYQVGLPYDWVGWSNGPPVDVLRAAMESDEKNGLLPSDPAELALTKGTASDGRAHYEGALLYAPAGAPIIDGGVTMPLDGTIVAMVTVSELPTSRGTITLSSSDPTAPPVIDPNYYATESDRVVMRSGVRQSRRVMEAAKNPDGSPAFVGEVLPRDGVPALTADSSDDEIDARVRDFGITTFHAGGGAALGSVVDAELRVKGVAGLRVVDASVMPGPLASHYQIALYAVAEQAAEMIAHST
ncbi:related to choline dehydrogenase and related flavoproteins [Cephalotrichum gorgonifer]|uniref:Related to choline dehydrogenase and related flavoproteins n=1 Tax=Cephalotrichum gorgonifer TaxID=2041049 RepID=A0AAE8SWV0_9PEZI|nr:related to choline dehydrogenase and related flavoproteins [Cephalotrichum gorgonifer]